MSNRSATAASRRIAAAALALASALGLGVLIAAPAVAFGGPELHISQVNPQTEGGAIVFSGSCPTGSVAAVVDVLRDSSVVLVHSDHMTNGEFTSDQFGFGAEPGETMSFTLTCYDADYDPAAGAHAGRNAVGAPVTESFTFPDHGSSVSIAPETAIDGQLLVTLSCGEENATPRLLLANFESGNQPLADWPQVQTAVPVSFGTPADFGAVPGQTLTVVLFCVGGDPDSPRILSQRSASTLVVGTTPAPTPPVKVQTAA